MRKLLYSGGILVVVSLAIFSACRSDVSKTQPTVESISESVYASGFVKSKHQYQVYSTVNGVIADIFVKEGDLVKPNTPLLRVYNKTSLLAEENARLNAEYASLESNQKKLKELALAVDLAKSKLEKDSLLWIRKNNLWNQNIGTKVELEQTEVAYKSAATSYQSALTQYSELKRQLALNSKQARNNFEISKTLTEEFIIASTIEGKVYNVMKERGELVTTQTPVALLGDAESFYLELQVDEYDIIKIREKQVVYVTMDSYQDQVFSATVTRINPVMNERSKSFTVDAEFNEAPSILYPFLTVEANIVIVAKQNALLIPRSYLLEDNRVMLENGELKEIRIGLSDYQKVEILEGLTKDDTIIKPNL